MDKYVQAGVRGLQGGLLHLLVYCSLRFTFAMQASPLAIHPGMAQPLTESQARCWLQHLMHEYTKSVAALPAFTLNGAAQEGARERFRTLSMHAGMLEQAFYQMSAILPEHALRAVVAIIAATHRQKALPTAQFILDGRTLAALQAYLVRVSACLLSDARWSQSPEGVRLAEAAHALAREVRASRTAFAQGMSAAADAERLFELPEMRVGRGEDDRGEAEDEWAPLCAFLGGLRDSFARDGEPLARPGPSAGASAGRVARKPSSATGREQARGRRDGAMPPSATASDDPFVVTGASPGHAPTWRLPTPTSTTAPASPLPSSSSSSSSSSSGSGSASSSSSHSSSTSSSTTSSSSTIPSHASLLPAFELATSLPRLPTTPRPSTQSKPIPSPPPAPRKRRQSPSPAPPTSSFSFSSSSPHTPFPTTPRPSPHPESPAHPSPPPAPRKRRLSDAVHDSPADSSPFRAPKRPRVERRELQRIHVRFYGLAGDSSVAAAGPSTSAALYAGQALSLSGVALSDLPQPQPQPDEGAQENARRDSAASWASSQTLSGSGGDMDVDAESFVTAPEEDAPWMEYVVYDPANAPEAAPWTENVVYGPADAPVRAPSPPRAALASGCVSGSSKAAGKRRCWDGVLRSVQSFFTVR